MPTDEFGLIAVKGHLRGQKIRLPDGSAKWYIDDFLSDDGTIFALSQSDVPEVVWAHPAKDQTDHIGMEQANADR